MIDRGEAIEEIFKSMEKTIDEFGEGLEKSGIQWKSPSAYDAVQFMYGHCNEAVIELREQTAQLKQLLINPNQVDLLGDPVDSKN